MVQSSGGKLEGRVAIVTGAAQGLGKAIAQSYFDEGAQVVLADVSETVGQVANEISADSSRVRACAFDVAKEDEWRTAIDDVVQNFGKIDILVNNAAVTMSKPIWDITVDEWDHVMAVNLRSVFIGCRMVGELMKKSGYGRLINLSSLAGQRGGVVAGAHYSATKGGILALSKCFAQELAPHGVTVNAIAPAAIEGPMSRAMPQEKVQGLAKTIPVQRLGRDSEVGAAAVYLASEEAGFVTGATLDVNGGVLMR